MDFELIVKEGKQPGRTFLIAHGASHTIGRAPDCDIRLPDQGVSRHHCSIQNIGDGLQVADLQSANGTYLNGEMVESGILRAGDQLAVGPSVLECQPKALDPVTTATGRPGTATLAFREEGSTTLLRKVVDTQGPGMTPTSPPLSNLEQLQQAQRNLATAFQVSQMLASARGLDALFEGVIESIFTTINADSAALLLKQDAADGSDGIDIVAARSRKEEKKPEEITVSRTVVQDVLENRASSLSRDAAADARYKEGESIIAQKIRSVMCAPVATEAQTLGVLYADSRSLTGAFSEADLEMLALIGNQAGIAIHRAQLLAELEQFFLDTIRAIVATIDAKDGYTHRHSERVASFAVRIATELGTDDAEEIEVIKLSGMLHDVGKIGVPEAILNKPGKLSDEEFEAVKKHPIHGVNILRNIKNPRFQAILPGVRHHHEKWDGSGYPDGLAAEDIPFLGRLLAVADVLDALSSDRSYRKSLGFDKTVEIIEKDAGTHFDPDIAAAAVALHERAELEVPTEWLEPGPDADISPTARV